MKRRLLYLLSLGLLADPAFAVDPPHATAAACGACHIPHLGAGGDLTSAAQNGNLCISCHQAGGTASAKSFASTDQALPWPGLPSGLAANGNSHRWDSGAAGHVSFLGGAAVPSTGALSPTGVYTGVYAKTYTITIASAGRVGAARFNWSATSPGGGSGANLLVSPTVPLDQGVLVAFTDGTNISFQAGDQWNLYVRPDLRNPTNQVLLAHTADGKASCSICHDEHSQQMAPFDPAAPAYAGAGTGTNRHCMRINNNAHQLCNDCHAARNTTNALTGSHPVEIPIPADAAHKAPSLLPLEVGSGNLGCLTCHAIHSSPIGDGKVLRLADSVGLCVDCHTMADTNSPAAHLARTDSRTLWPGGRFGSLMPARTSAADQGTCLNCHPVHGWPDSANPTNHYPQLLADFEENLCFTCHGTNGPAIKQVQADFAKLRHHPVRDAEQVAGRKVECTDCHNSHVALAGGLNYTNTATAARNQITNPLKGVSGIAVNYSGLGNFVAPTP